MECHGTSMLDTVGYCWIVHMLRCLSFVIRCFRDEAEMEEQIRASLQGTQGFKGLMRYDVIGASGISYSMWKICEIVCLFQYVFSFSASFVLERAILLRAFAKNATSEGWLDGAVWWQRAQAQSSGVDHLIWFSSPQSISWHFGLRFFFNRKTEESLFDDPRHTTYHSLYTRIRQGTTFRHLTWPLLVKDRD